MKKIILTLTVVLFTSFQLFAQQFTPPPGVKIDTFGQIVHKPHLADDEEHLMSSYGENDEIQLFPECVKDIRYFRGIQLSVKDEELNTPLTDWSYTVKFQLFISGQPRFTSELNLNMAEQKMSTYVFDDQVSEIIPATSYIKITEIIAENNPPTSQIEIKALTFEEGSNPVDPAIRVTAGYNSTVKKIIWNDVSLPNQILDEYEVEWTFVDDEEKINGNQVNGYESNELAFKRHQPTRVSTKNNYYLIDQLFPSGMIYYRVRTVSHLPDQTNHKIYGKWSYVGFASTIFKNDADNWEQVITFAEDGKNKKVVTYYDKTLRPVQTITNLNHEKKTLISESKYDFEGRKVIDFLPYVRKSWDPDKVRKGNTFVNKADFDNGRIINNSPAGNSSASYYDTHEEPTVPKANGYSYVQTEFQNDGNSRVTRQSGVGQEFFIDGGRNTHYLYATAGREELVRLFGDSNIQNDKHYRKVATIDPNGQASVSYLDPAGRTIATALAGDPPVNLDALSDYDDNAEAITITIEDNYREEENGSFTTYHSILNTTTTEYTFNYQIQAPSIAANTICPECSYDIAIKLIDPDGIATSLHTASGVKVLEGCTPLSPNALEPALTITCDKVGVYTIIKELKTYGPTYETARATLLSASDVQTALQNIENIVAAVNSTDCDIEMTADYTLLADMIRDNRGTECEAIKVAIINDIISANTTAEITPTYEEVEEGFYEELSDYYDGVMAHPNYCEYQFCSMTIESEVFDGSLFTISSWDSKYFTSLQSMVNADDFFTNQLSPGYGKQERMVYLANNYKIAVGSLSIIGSIWDLVDINEPDMLFNENGTIYHRLYYPLQKSQPANLATQINERRWNLFRGFYLDVKNRLKLEMAEEASCMPLIDKYKFTDIERMLGADGQLQTNEILQTMDFVDSLILDTITNQELEIKYRQLTSACNSSLSAQEKDLIISLLRTFFDDNRLNYLRLFPYDLFSIEPYSKIAEILHRNGCGHLSQVSFVTNGITDCVSCDPFYLDIFQIIQDQKTRCLAIKEAERTEFILAEQEKYLNERIRGYLQEYSCTGLFEENFSYSYKPKEYHYTLYYYDRAGNLVQTVPPEGVNTGEIAGQHSMTTRYYYNSMNQLVSQSSPDGGRTEFLYNRFGQLRFSQNAQQKIDNQYSYTKYDKIGRIIEVGQFSSGLTVADFTGSPSINDRSFPFRTSPTIVDFTRTYYDQPANPTGLKQKNVRGRVSYVELYDDQQNKAATTYYSYDVHGNVKSLLQVINGLDPKRVDYGYDLISGNVNYVSYQYGKDDQFFHHYLYDADNRLIKVETSVDGLIWNSEADYQYLAHGPLRRVELGDGQNLQGLDYYYTLQGWLKGLNAPDPNGLGIDTELNFPKDVVSFSLGYYAGDYTPQTSNSALDVIQNSINSQTENSVTPKNLYNGNIAWMSTWLKGTGDEAGADEKGMLAMVYRYDQLNRIKQARGLSNYNLSGGFANRGIKGKYDTDYTYDGNGNIQSLKRLDHNQLLTDDLIYDYEDNNNRLLSVTGTKHESRNIGDGEIDEEDEIHPFITVDGEASIPSGEDVTLVASQKITFKKGFRASAGAHFRGKLSSTASSEFPVGNYEYDKIGNLTKDNTEGVEIDWTVYGKVDKVTKGDGAVTDYTYDPAGNRVKKVTVKGGKTSRTFYVRDATGNILAVYERNDDATETDLKEVPIYGSSRLGQFTGGGEKSSFYLGKRRYEISNHLGNVLTTITDELKIDANGDREVVIASASDYYPFGMQMPGRSRSTSSYRYGFQGQEEDKETGFVNYKYRLHNPRIGRFFTIDPLVAKYPHNSPYAFSENRVTDGIELEGAEFLGTLTMSWWSDLTGRTKSKMKNGDSFTVAYLKGSAESAVMHGLVLGVGSSLPFATTSGTAVGVAKGFGLRYTYNVAGQFAIHSSLDAFSDQGFSFRSSVGKIDWLDATFSSVGLKGLGGYLTSVVGSSIFDYTAKGGFQSIGYNKSVGNSLIDFGVNSLFFAAGGAAGKYFDMKVFNSKLKVNQLQSKYDGIDAKSFNSMNHFFGAKRTARFYLNQSKNILNSEINIRDFFKNTVGGQTFNAGASTGASEILKDGLQMHTHEQDNTTAVTPKILINNDGSD